ncbi:MAG: NAD(P)H-hydrate dehydratase [Clostridia bacterium]|nr:NAD(P)H-hydrate dehydratase [Clostridia bacterium]
MNLKDYGIVEGDGIYILKDRDISAFFPQRERNTHKGSYGTACVVAGSERYLGAPFLAVSSALRSGCGYVYAVVPEIIKSALVAAYPQSICCETPFLKANAIAVGMGMDCTQATYDTVKDLILNYEGKLIIDADGLNALAKFGKDILKSAKSKILLTPHVGEMARLAGISADEVLSDAVGVAKSFATEYNVCVHLKNAVSVTCDGSGVVVCTRGNSALAKAGSGDILSGLICGNAARGLSLKDAAASSQYVLGFTAEICAEQYGEYSLTAKEITDNLYIAIKRLTQTRFK